MRVNSLKGKVTLVAILLLSHSAVYVLGSSINRQGMLSGLSQEFNRSNASLNLGRYTEYRDIALDIKASKYEIATCSAELGASAMYDDLKSCLANQGCKDAVEPKLREVAPEVLGEAPLRFTYLKGKDGIRLCK